MEALAGWKSRGCGMGLRSQHYPAITESWPEVDWFEAISENYMDTGGRPLHILEKIRQRYPVALHGTALSIGSVDPLHLNYLARLKALIQRIDPFIVSDHLSWAGTEGEQLHDLLPLPFTEEALQHVISRVGQVQEILGRQILLENVSTYVTFRHSTIPEWDFLSEVSNRSGCGILLDLNNIYVNAVNHRFDPFEYLKAVPADRIGQIHLAGHTDRGDFLFDTHSRPIIDKVWALYEEALRRWGPISTLIEWDEDIPVFEELNEEVERAKVIYRKYGIRETGDGIQKTVGSRQQTADGRQKTVNANSFQIPLAQAQSLLKTRIRGSDEKQKELDQLLNPQGHATGNQRLEVYAQGYPARVRESIAEVYETLRAVMEEEAFEVLCLEYAAHHGAEDYNLNHAGKDLEEFLKISPFSKKALFLPDLARFEWALWEVFHAVDSENFMTKDGLERIPAEDWERSVFYFKPSVRTFESPWPVLDLWRYRRDKTAVSNVLLEGNPQRVLISRLGDQVRCELMTSDQRRLVEMLMAGATLGTACETLAEISEAEELPIASWFHGWVRDGLITRCDFVENTAASS